MTLRVTVRHGISEALWNTIARSRPGPLIGRPSMRICPLVVACRPSRQCSSVVLPQPLGADDADELTGCDRERSALQSDGFAAATALVGDTDVHELDQGHGYLRRIYLRPYGTAGGSGFPAQKRVRVMQKLFARLRTLMLAGALLASVAAPARAQSAPVEITFGILTPTSAEWPLFLAETQGFYKDEGIQLTVINGSTPPNVISSVATGGVDMADNGCDSELVAIQHGLPIKIVTSLFNVNPYSLVVGPGVKSWADLKGKSVILGTKQDVTAIALSSMAAMHKLTLDDFSIIIGGNSTARYAALNSGNVQGAMLAQPFDLIAESKGDLILGTASDTIKDWAFTCVAVNNAWAKQNRPLVLKFMRALRKGIQYGYAHKDAAVAALVAQTHADPAIAAKAWDLDFGKWKAFDPNLRLSATAMQSIGKYQMGFGIIPSMPAMSDLYDPSFAADAFK